MGSGLSFDPNEGVRTGTPTKFYQKAVLALTDRGQRWNVTPQLLRHLVENQPPGESQVAAQPG